MNNEFMNTVDQNMRIIALEQAVLLHRGDVGISGRQFRVGEALDTAKQFLDFLQPPADATDTPATGDGLANRLAL